MDVRCDRCKAQYVLDDEQVTPSGLTVKCTNCGHVFKVKKKEPAVPAPSGARSEWRVRVASGGTFTFCELTTLQKWIVEQRVSRDDEISLGGEEWRRLGSIGELSSFFEVVEAAASQPPRAPRADPGLLPPVHEVDLGLDAEPAARKRARTGVRVAIGLLLVAGVAAAGAAVVLARRPPRTEPKPPPIVVAAPPPKPEPPPVVPVPAPEPVPEAAPPPPPQPLPKPVVKAPPPLGPRVLLAQARKLREGGNVEAALELYGRVVALEPENADALSGRGLCYLDLGSYPPAEASFEAALEVESRHPEARLGLAETYRYAGKKADAIRQYERYLAEHPAGDEADVARNAIEQLRN